MVRSLSMIAVLLVTLASLGCRFSAPASPLIDNTNYLQTIAESVEYPDVIKTPTDRYGAAVRPHSLANGEPTQYWDMTLDGAIQIALTNSNVLRDLLLQLMAIGPIM